MNKAVKALLIVLAAIVMVGAIGFTILYVNVNAVRFDYVSRNFSIGNSDIKIPFFGNKIMIGESGGIYATPLGMGVKNLKVYDAVNDPIYLFSSKTASKYENGVHITDYQVENDGKLLSIKISGTAQNGGETIPIEKLFVFNIENASPDNLPKWTNRTEADYEYYPDSP